MSLHRIDRPASDPTTRPTSDTTHPGTASAQPRDRRASHPAPNVGNLARRRAGAAIHRRRPHHPRRRARRRIGHGAHRRRPDPHQQPRRRRNRHHHRAAQRRADRPRHRGRPRPELTPCHHQSCRRVTAAATTGPAIAPRRLRIGAPCATGAPSHHRDRASPAATSPSRRPRATPAAPDLGRHDASGAVVEPTGSQPPHRAPPTVHAVTPGGGPTAPAAAPAT